MMQPRASSSVLAPRPMATMSQLQDSLCWPPRLHAISWLYGANAHPFRARSLRSTHSVGLAFTMIRTLEDFVLTYGARICIVLGLFGLGWSFVFFVLFRFDLGPAQLAFYECTAICAIQGGLLFWLSERIASRSSQALYVCALVGLAEFVSMRDWPELWSAPGTAPIYAVLGYGAMLAMTLLILAVLTLIYRLIQDGRLS